MAELEINQNKIIPNQTNPNRTNIKGKQAGAELCQAQGKLWLAGL